MPGQRGNAGAWSGRLAVPLHWRDMAASPRWVSLASDHKATQEQIDINHAGVSPCMALAIYLV